MKLNYTLWIIVGMVMGLFIAKGLAFSAEESFWWSVFWDSVKHGKLSLNDFDGIWKSTTFIKSAVGTFLGGIVGFSIKKIINHNIKRKKI